MTTDYGLFILKREQKTLEDKIEGILDGCLYAQESLQRRNNRLTRYEEQLGDIKYTIRQLELNKLRD
ncbi:hypothetical protein ABEO76_22325 [Bacillus anthracis]|uniref:hypothetical protein n=1 Tax=Bacillus anthracis TaxID=1392 RepID=UPI003D2048EA